MSGLFFGGGKGPPDVSGVRIQTAVQGLPVPLVYGRARLAANLIHMLDLTQQSVGGKAASKSGSAQYTYRAAIILALCEGTIAGIINGWTDKDGALAFSAYLSKGWSLFTGSPTQAPWSYLTAHHPSEAVPYQSTAYLAHQAIDMPSGVLPNLSWEVDGLFAIGGGIVDANPKDIIVDLVTNVVRGLAIPAGILADLTSYATYCLAADLLLSPAFKDLRPAREHLQQVLDASCSEAVWSDGTLKIIPYCDEVVTGHSTTYTPNVTPLYDLTDDDFLRESPDAEPIRIRRKAAADAYNEFTVNYEDRIDASGTTAYSPGTATATDQASRDTGVYRPAQKTSLPLIKRASVAQYVAQMMLQRELNVRNTYEFRLPWKFSLLEPMDLVTVTDLQLGLSRTPVRITDIVDSENDAGLDVVAEDWPFGTATPTRYTTQIGAGSTPAQGAAPGNTSTPVIFDSPGAQDGDPLEIIVAAAGGSNWGGCDVHVSTDGTQFYKVGTITKKATYGVLTAGLAAASPLPAIDTTHTLSVDVTSSGGALASGVVSDVAALLTLCWVGGEFLSFETASLISAFNYALTTLGRGAYGTAAVAHLSGESFARCDDAVLHLPFPQGTDGQTLYFKLPAFNIYGRALEDISIVPTFTHVIANVAAPLEARVVRSTAPTGEVTAEFYVADPAPAAKPITISANFVGATAVVPLSTTLTYPGDPITNDLNTTDFASFAISPPAAGESVGEVTFTAEREGRRPVSITIDIEPVNAAVAPPIAIVGTVAAEATAADGTAAGMVYIPLTFSALIDHYLIFTAEAATSGVAVPDRTDASRSIQVKRLDGILESADDWQTMVMIATGANNYRAYVIIAVGPTGLQSDPTGAEIQAIDTGTAPTSGPTSVTVVDSTVGGVARKSLTISGGDALASRVVLRNMAVVAVLAPGTTTFDDDGVSPLDQYTFMVFFWRNGQSTAVASSGSPSSPSTPTLVAPTWASGYPNGYTVGPHFYARVGFVNPDPLAYTDVYSSAPSAGDVGPYTLVASIDPGQSGIRLSSLTSDDVFLYLKARRAGYTDSLESAHEEVTYGG